MQVKDLMTTDVVTVGLDASLREAVGKLLEKEVGSVIVLNEDEDPVGIVTESDALHAAYATEMPLRDIPVTKLAHHPVVTIDPSATVQMVAKRMADNSVKKVPVMDGIELIGIITLTDIVWHLSDIRAEVGDLMTEPKERQLD